MDNGEDVVHVISFKIQNYLAGHHEVCSTSRRCACIRICAIMSYGDWADSGDQQQMQYYLAGHQEA